MGAFGEASRWTPEDDYLLKSAVEAGASLESLAKGAVKFSQKFSVREVQERWYSMLYDPVVSAEASAGIIKSERSKVNKVGVLKENNCATGKRNPETVHSSYYALRKRICSESFEDLSFLVGPTNRDVPLSGNTNPGEPISDPFGFQVSEMHSKAHGFPDSLLDVDSAGSELQHPPVDNLQTDQSNLHKECSRFLGANMPSTGNRSEVGGIGGPKDLPNDGLFKPIEQLNGDQSNTCLEFEGNKIFDSPVSGCVAPFNNMEYSPLPEMPIWKTPSAPALPVDIGLGDKNLLPGDDFHVPDDYGMNTRTSGLEVHSGIKAKLESGFDNFQVHSSPEGYFAELSNSLLNFTNEEELLMNGEGKDFIDKSYFDGLSSLLLNSPNDISEERAANITGPEISAPPDESVANLGPFHESDKASDRHDDQMSYDSQVQTQQQIWPPNYDFPEYKNGVICCVLNTEDPDIPCNDHVVFDMLLLSTTPVTDQSFQGAGISISSSSQDVDRNQRISERGPNLRHGEQEERGSQAAQEKGPSHGISNFEGLKFYSAYVESRVSDLGLINRPNASAKGLFAEMQKDKAQEESMANHSDSSNSSIMKPAIVSASINSYSQENFNFAKEKRGVVLPVGDQESKHAEPMSMNVDVSSEPILSASAADEHGMTFESTGDIPYYADIEAMILDMDLDPDVHDLKASEEVSKFQDEETRRTIIRLEQSAQAHTRRDIASHGALAILYGRHSRHYVKKPEVLLGRATNEDIVDIDLGREGQPNKISRKQAIITMDKSGSFSLKNISNAPICVNGKEVGFRQSIILNSGCLIEIRGLPFIFEMNQTRVKTYLDSVAGATQAS